MSTFRVKSLANPSKKFKVHMNAKQLQMTGIMLMLEDINVIIVEGGEIFYFFLNQFGVFRP